MSDLMPTASPARRPWHALLILVLGVWLALLAPALSAQEVGLAARVNGVAITVFRLERYFEDRAAGLLDAHRVHSIDLSL